MPELGEGDEEQGEELLPVTNTDDVSLLGQTPQSTDVPLPRPPPHAQLRRVRCCDCLAFWLQPVLYRLGFILYWTSAFACAFAFVSIDSWIRRDLPVWVKVLLGLIALPGAFIFGMSLRADQQIARSRT